MSAYKENSKKKRDFFFKILLSLGFHVDYINLFQFNNKSIISMKKHSDIVNKHFT